jgi:hypothetical protein
MTTRSTLRTLAATVAAGAAALAVSAPALATQQLNGVFHVGAGSYIRMGLPGGGFFSNPYSRDANKTYTLIQSGPGAGLRTGVAQRPPSPAFDAHGDSRASAIVAPTNFTGIRFGVITTLAPTITVSNGRLTAYIRHLYAQWNRQTFLQGAIASGTYNSRTHQYSLSWHAQVHGGPFDGYTGDWHLQGRFSGA